jgi:transcriptional regulator with XRE-family HTH domain
MTAALTLAPNAHMQAAIAELLLAAPHTMAELAGELRISLNDAEHILTRLRCCGLPVTIIEDLDPEPRYRILYPKGRVCSAEGCGTILRRSNPSERCELHGGGSLRLQTPAAMPRPTRGDTAGSSCDERAPRPRPRLRPVPRLDGARIREERERRGLSVRRLAALADLSPAYLSRIERGQRGLSGDVADLLEAALEVAPIRVAVDWRVRRMQAGLSLREVARRAGVDAAVLSRVERGERRASPEIERRLFDALARLGAQA